jgi:hypothetical protein
MGFYAMFKDTEGTSWGYILKIENQAERKPDHKDGFCQKS